MTEEAEEFVGAVTIVEEPAVKNRKTIQELVGQTGHVEVTTEPNIIDWIMVQFGCVQRIIPKMVVVVYEPRRAVVSVWGSHVRILYANETLFQMR